MPVTVGEIVVADPADVWAAAGFAVGPDAVCRVGGVGIRLAGRGAGSGIVRWSLAGLPGGLPGGELDGIPTATTSTEAAPAGPPAEHANGVVGIDHVVLMTPDVERTARTLAGVGLEPRRVRDGELGGAPVRQVFYRLGEVVLEVVGAPDEASEGPATLWGITFVVADIDAAAAFLGEGAGRVKDAVQPGRRITTLRHRSLGMSVATALISPDVRPPRRS
ncbi:MAG TPA: VOC family protein [Nocardioides sp.]|nr:VOC family protein [Nocardioides sp.]